MIAGMEEPLCVYVDPLDDERSREKDRSAIGDLLIGRRVVGVADETLTLDDGTVLVFAGNEGCQAIGCGHGDYRLTELNGVDNVITSVEFDDAPDGAYGDGNGRYRLFVLAGETRVNLATFEGTDGNGYYCSGYEVYVNPAAETLAELAERRGRQQAQIDFAGEAFTLANVIASSD
jgi:hypothetical protein